MDFIHKLERDYNITIGDAEIAKLRRQFDSADANKDGEITVEEFKHSIGDDSPTTSLVQVIAR
jgi:Ca2+-binding EF-hand superfamily protein